MPMPLSKSDSYFRDVLAAFVCSTLLSGCVIVTDVETHWGNNGVDKIQFDARGTLYITQGRRNELRLEGDNGALETLAVEQRDGTVFIDESSSNWRWFEVSHRGQDPVYHLEVDDISKIVHSGQGTIKVGPLTTERLVVEVQDHAKIFLAAVNAPTTHITAQNHASVRIETVDSRSVLVKSDDHADVYVQDASVLDAAVVASGHSEIWLGGAADTSNVVARDHSNVVAGELASAVAEVRASDYANVLVNVSQSIDQRALDHSTIDVEGAANSPPK